VTGITRRDVCLLILFEFNRTVDGIPLECKLKDDFCRRGRVECGCESIAAQQGSGSPGYVVYEG